jgi:hypothetical protein
MTLSGDTGGDDPTVAFKGNRKIYMAIRLSNMRVVGVKEWTSMTPCNQFLERSYD